MRALFRALCLHAIRRSQYRGGGTVGKHRKPSPSPFGARYSLALLTAGQGARSRPTGHAHSAGFSEIVESDQRRESVKSFANALIDALQRIAVALFASRKG